MGKPWNQQAVQKGIGVAGITDDEIWKDNPEKVFSVSAEWAKENPNTHLAVVKALIRAAMWLDADNNHNREEAVEILSMSQYVGAPKEVLAASMTNHGADAHAFVLWRPWLNFHTMPQNVPQRGSWWLSI